MYNRINILAWHRDCLLKIQENRPCRTKEEAEEVIPHKQETHYGGRKCMVDFRLLNGKPRATLIQRFDGSALLLGPKGRKIEFEDGVTLHQIQTKVEELGWVIGVEHLHRERESRA